MALIYIIIATLLISLISLIGIIATGAFIKKALHYVISFAAGVLISVALFDLIPHATEEIGHFEDAALFVVAGIVLFFIVERFIHWHHCGKDHEHHECKHKPAGVLMLFGDFVHNFLDGLLIAGAFIVDVNLGIFTTFTVAIHEIPQEFGDFAVLIHSGYTKSKALMLNFLSALSAVVGGLLGYFMFDAIESWAAYAVLITGGGFLYIALSDIMPNMHAHKNKNILVIESLIFILTIIGFYFLVGFVHGSH
ncbi:ZIP family metal transporter [Candidatus Woesearchaeota archaeon]|nr:ZIP family metal transporter [Candidatus Woesearchaeota archaeon]